MNDNPGSDICKIKYPIGIRGSHVDTSMAHRGAEIIMPVGPMDTITFVKIHGVRDICQIIARSCHVGAEKFDIDLVFSYHGGVSPGSR